MDVVFESGRLLGGMWEGLGLGLGLRSPPWAEEVISGKQGVAFWVGGGWGSSRANFPVGSSLKRAACTRRGLEMLWGRGPHDLPLHWGMVTHLRSPGNGQGLLGFQGPFIGLPVRRFAFRSPVTARLSLRMISVPGVT